MRQLSECIFCAQGPRQAACESVYFLARLLQSLDGPQWPHAVQADMRAPLFSGTIERPGHFLWYLAFYSPRRLGSGVGGPQVLTDRGVQVRSSERENEGDRFELFNNVRGQLTPYLRFLRYTIDIFENVMYKTEEFTAKDQDGRE